MERVKSAIRAMLSRRGYQLSRVQRNGYPLDFHPETIQIVRQVAPFTMTSPERLQALVASLQYLVGNRIPGAIVECGVWRGGSMMAAALTLRASGDLRELYLFDAFDAPLPVPTDADRTISGDRPLDRGAERRRYWSYVTADEVRANLMTTGYPGERMHLIQGLVEETLPDHAPETIALLRLDTDWYESTLHELRTLYPRLSPYGVLIVDEFGGHAGVKQAATEFFADHPFRPLLQRIDISGALAIKPQQ